MKTRLATLAVPLLVLAGCANNNASVRVDSICAPPDDATKCSFASTCQAQFIGDVILDVGLVQDLQLFIQVDNQLPLNDNAGTNRTNTNDAWVQEYEIDYPGTGLPTARGPIPGSSIVPASGSAVISLPAIDTATGAVIAAALGAGSQIDGVAEVKLHGVYADTTKFVTGVFKIAMRACRGCIAPANTVLTCPTATDVVFTCPQFGQTPASIKCAPAN